MTASIPENGLRARLHRLARRSVVVAAITGISFASLTGAGAGSAFAATTSPDENLVGFHVAAGLRGTVTPGSAVAASLTVQNDSTSRLPSGQVTVELNRTSLGDEAALTSWLDDGDAAGTFDEVGTDTFAPVDPDGTVTSTLFLLPETLGDLSPGVYPLRASLTGATDGELTSASVLVVTETASAPIAVVVPITATPADGALLTADELTALTAADGELTAVLEGVSGTSAVLAIDPSIVAAIRVLGSSAPEPVAAWLRRLDALPNERFALQFADADVAAQSQAGLTTALGPTTLASYLDPSDFVTASATAGPTPTATPTQTPPPAEGPVLPDDTALTAVDGAIPGVVWPRSALGESDLAAFASYFGDDAVTILPSSSTGGTVGGNSTIDGRAVLVAAATASAALSQAASENSAPERLALLTEASARLSISTRTSPASPVLVALSRDETRSTDALKETIGAIDTPGFGLSGILDSPAVVTTLTSEPDPARGTALQRMLEGEVALGAFATILDDPQLLLSPKRIQILRATAVGLGDEAFDKAVTEVHAATGDTLRSVDIPQASTIQLLSANADLPFSVRNDLPWPVNVRLAVSPADTRLEVESPRAATVQAGTTTRIRVPVSARVGSGEVRLGLELSSPTGVTIGQPETVRVSVRAEWETIGLIVFGGLIVLLLGLGTIRTVVRRRRENGTEAEPEKTDAVTAEDTR